MIDITLTSVAAFLVILAITVVALLVLAGVIGFAIDAVRWLAGWWRGRRTEPPRRTDLGRRSGAIRRPGRGGREAPAR